MIPPMTLTTPEDDAEAALTNAGLLHSNPSPTDPPFPGNLIDLTTVCDPNDDNEPLYATKDDTIKQELSTTTKPIITGVPPMLPITEPMPTEMDPPPTGVPMTIFLEFACFTIVGDSNGMKTMHPAVGPHVAGLGHLLTLAASRATTAPPAIGVMILVDVLCILCEEG